MLYLSNEAFFLNQNCSLVVWKYLGAYSFCGAVLVARYHQVFAEPIHKGGILDAASINFLLLKESHNLAFICSAAKFKPIIENSPFFLKPEKEQVCKKSKITRDNSLGLLKVEVIDICRGFGNQLLAKLELWRVWSCNCGDNMCNPLPLKSTSHQCNLAKNNKIQHVSSKSLQKSTRTNITWPKITKSRHERSNCVFGELLQTARKKRLDHPKVTQFSLFFLFF